MHQSVTLIRNSDHSKSTYHTRLFHHFCVPFLIVTIVTHKFYYNLYLFCFSIIHGYAFLIYMPFLVPLFLYFPVANKHLRGGVLQGSSWPSHSSSCSLDSRHGTGRDVTYQHMATDDGAMI